jgi:4-hydroxythreonine-4-phosphate dehydrogenase
MSHTEKNKPKIGITIGDYNGVGVEVILKAFSDNRLFEYCTPVVYGSTKIIAYHKKALNIDTVNHQQLKPGNAPAAKLLNVINCINENVIINLGTASPQAGESALVALDAALKDLKDGTIDALVTAPLDKSLIKPKTGTFTGHTEYIANYFGVPETVMLLTCDFIKVGLVTNHIPVKEVATALTTKKILTKIEILNESLFKDFGIAKPKIAVLGLNPHAGDNGLLGSEEKEIIVPAIKKAQENGILAYGPYAADGLMGSGQYDKFDVVLAMYHDQGLVAFKSLCFGSGVNFTAGLPVVRTSPDHGTAFDIAGKDLALPDSFREAVFTAIDIVRNRKVYNEITANPLKKQKIESER